jgi:hypothetical protein
MFDKLKDYPGYQRAFIFSVLFLAVVALVDAVSMNRARDMGFDLNMASSFMQVYIYSFWTLFFVIVLALGAFYFVFVHRDFSEAFAVSFTALSLQNWGVEDVLYYIVSWTPMPYRLDYLDGHWLMGGVANFLGLSGVTSGSLVLSAAIGLIGTYYINKYLWVKI